MLGKIKRRDAIHALAPAADVERLLVAQHITRLAPVGGFSRHRIHAIDRHHRQNFRAPAIRHADLIFVAGFAHHVIATVVLMNRQRAVFHTIVHRHVSDAAHRTCHTGESGGNR